MKKSLIIRLILFVLFSILLPILFIAFRYGIFKNPSKMSLSGVGIISIILIVGFTIYIALQIKKALPFSIVSQVITGILFIIVPLLCLIWFLSSIKNSIDVFINCLIFITISELIAIPINPIPKIQELTKEDKEKSLVKKIADAVKGEEE